MQGFSKENRIYPGMIFFLVLITFQELLLSGLQTIDSVTNFLFSSGTTGDPKAIPWTQLSPIRCAADTWAHIDTQVRGVYCGPTNLRRVMGLIFTLLRLSNRFNSCSVSQISSRLWLRKICSGFRSHYIGNSS
ncbi:hypothetical protein COP2_005699 [Malus domestica]